MLKQYATENGNQAATGEARVSLFWWAIMAQSQKEALADYWLRDRGLVTYFPHEKVKPSWKAKRCYDADGNYIGASKTLSELRTRRAFIPSYLFVEARVDQLASINDSIGVSSVVYAPGGEPFPIPREVMALLMERLGMNGQIHAHLPPKQKFEGKPGDQVRGKEGWKHWNFLGTITSICGDRVKVNLLMLGAVREWDVPAESLDLVERFDEVG